MKRAARKELKSLAKSEVVNEEEQAKETAELELREQEELLHSQLSDTSQVYQQNELWSPKCRLFPCQCRALWDHCDPGGVSA